jgi:hypothetical protein
MNGIMPGPLFLAVASAAPANPCENASPTHRGRSDTVAGKNPSTAETAWIAGPLPEALQCANRRGRCRDTRPEQPPTKAQK